MTVICVVLCCPYMVMECVNAATVVTCIDLRSDQQLADNKHTNDTHTGGLQRLKLDCMHKDTNKPFVK